jgi:opacity protein-like surface antigen
MRRAVVRLLLSFVVLTVVAGVPTPAAAQFGVGGRLAFVKAPTDTDPDTDESVRFTGVQIRFSGQRTGLEISFDRKTQTFEALDEKVKETPIQASLLLFLAGGGFKPYLLGGPGWYKRRVESLTDAEEPVSTTKFGWHGGFGAELRMGRHAGLHADYRYTFLSFDDDDDDAAAGAAPATGNDSFISGLLPSHDGSMWTVGVTFYF